MKRKPPTGTCVFTGVFPGCRTRCQFKISLDSLTMSVVGAQFVKSYRTAIARSYPDPAVRPALRKLQITIQLPP